MNDTVPEDKFHTELRDLINKHSKENGSNTPDFVLAEFLTQSLAAFDYATRYRTSVVTLPDEHQTPKEAS